MVLLAGLGIACVTSVLEFLWKGKSKAKDSSMVVKGLAKRRSNIMRIKPFGDRRGLRVRLDYSNINKFIFQFFRYKMPIK